MSRGPVIAAWLLGILTAVALAGSVYRVPIQVSDSLEVIQRVVPMPSATAAFVEGLHNSATMLRPLKEVRTKLLVEAGNASGGRYHLIFRGYHALAGALLIGLFVWVCRARTWTDVAALSVGLVVLTGMHTFVGLFREAFPVNHFLIVAICALATVAVAQTRGGWLADLVAAGLFALAALSFESGLLVWPVAVAAYASGLRGISRRGLVAMTVVLLVYAGARGYLLTEPTLGVGQRGTGFGAGALTPEEQVARFGANPLPFYAYNVAAASSSVLFSQPTIGQFTAINAWRNGSLPPVYMLQIGSSLLTSLLIGWYVLGKDEQGRRRWREPVPLAFITTLAVSAVMSYSLRQGRDHQHRRRVLRVDRVPRDPRAARTATASVARAGPDRSCADCQRRVGDALGGTASEAPPRRIRGALGMDIRPKPVNARDLAHRPAHAARRLPHAG